MKFSVNTMNFFIGLPLIDQLGAIKKSGFEAVEILFPYMYGLDQVKAGLEESGLTVSIIDVLPGDLSQLDFNAAIDPARRDEFKKNAEQALEYATELKTPNVNCLAGMRIKSDELPEEKQLDVYKENLAYICDLFKGTDIQMLVEPVSEGTMADYLVDNLHLAAGIIKELNRDNLALQYDFFHIQLLHGNLVGNMKKYFDMIRYFQIANPPGRNEPGCGEIDFHYVLQVVKESGYDGYVGLEYNPADTEEESFKWINEI